jgi:hypothetical protein
VFDRGKGIFIFDENGKDYIESVSCFYCVSLGFSEERLVEAATRQLKALPMYSSAIHRTVPAVMELTERLAALSPVKNPRIYFSTTGSEANDHLIKFMWYGNGFAGEPNRRKMISRRASYHGSTIATSALGGSQELHESFGIPMGFSLQVSHPSWPNAALPGENEEAFTDRLAANWSRCRGGAGNRGCDDRRTGVGLLRHVPATRQLLSENHQGAAQIRRPAFHRRSGDGLRPLRAHVGHRIHGPRARLPNLRQGHFRRLYADCRHCHG